MTLKDADKIKEAIKKIAPVLARSDDIIKVIDSVPEVVIDTDTDTISRQAAIDAVQNRPMMLSKEKVLLINDIEKLPSVEPKRGKWIKKHRH